MVVVVPDSSFESGWRARRLNAPDESFGDQNAEGVIDRLERDRTDLSSDRFGHRIGCDVRLSRDDAKDGQTLGCDLDASLPQQLRGIDVHPNILDQILE